MAWVREKWVHNGSTSAVIRALAPSDSARIFDVVVPLYGAWGGSSDMTFTVYVDANISTKTTTETCTM